MNIVPAVFISIRSRVSYYGFSKDGEWYVFLRKRVAETAIRHPSVFYIRPASPKHYEIHPLTRIN